MRSFAPLALAASAIALAGAGCIYAPLDLDLEDFGKVQEVTLIDGPVDSKLLLLRIDGEISDHAEPEGLFGVSESMVARVRDVLDLAKEDERVKGLIVRIDSPGGGVTASDIIYREILDWKRKTEKPVVALFMDVAASGGYYVAQAADRIIAHPTCLTGSIGVVAMLPNLSGLAGKVGVDVHVIKSGALKDMGNPFRPFEPAEREVFQKLIDDMYAKFVNVVHDGRRRAGLTRDDVLRLADGRVYTAADAKNARLIDDIGYFPEAIAAAKRLAKIEKARVVTYERKGIGTGRHTIYSRGDLSPIQANVLGRAAGDTNLLKIDAAAALGARRRPIFNYLWVP